MKRKNYFGGITTAKGAHSRWKNLAKRHHPDAGGDSDTMAEINMQYSRLLADIAARRVTPRRRSPSPSPPLPPEPEPDMPEGDDQLLESVEALGRAAATLLGEILVRTARRRWRS